MLKTTIATQNIKLRPIKQDLGGELSDQISYRCSFCFKLVGLYPTARRICEKLSGDDFYCAHCLRNSFNTKASRHILILSFRAVIGYYYEALYNTTPRELWISEIEDYVQMHSLVGQQNPVFKYDPESMLWFVDFSKIGRGKKKIRITDVLKTVINVLACFNLHQHVPLIKMSKFYGKYEEAITKFYRQRYRPDDKPLLIPTLAGCSEVDPKKVCIDDTRDFTSCDLVKSGMS